MKPLTIEELKKLEVGDWVYIVHERDPYYGMFYVKKISLPPDLANDWLYLGTQGCIYTFRYSEFGTTLRAYKNKEQAEGKEDSINVLKAENERLHDYKCKLEKELIERGFAEYAHGNFRLLSDEEREEAAKDTAKEILTDLRKDISQCYGDYALEIVDDYIERYGVEVEG